jgi:hypothetical protein
MKRAIIGLGMGAMILLCWTTSPQAYDRDINLPSTNQSDPIGIYQPDEGDDSGWTDPHNKNGTILNSSRFYDGKRFIGFNFFYKLAFIGIKGCFYRFVNTMGVVNHHGNNEQDTNQSQAAPGSQ